MANAAACLHDVPPESYLLLSANYGKTDLPTARAQRAMDNKVGRDDEVVIGLHWYDIKDDTGSPHTCGQHETKFSVIDLARRRLRCEQSCRAFKPINRSAM